MSDFDELLSPIAAEKRDEFRLFVETGEASEEFLKYLDTDEEAQKAIEKAFNAQAAALSRVADMIGKGGVAGVERESAQAYFVDTAIAVEKVAKNLAGIPKHQLKDVAQELVQREGVEHGLNTKATFSDFAEALGSVTKR